MKLIDELDGKLRNLWKFTSVWFSTFALACGSTLAAYAAGKALGMEVVAHVPQWLLDALIYGSMASSFASIIARGIPQPKLREPACIDDNSEHA